MSELVPFHQIDGDDPEHVKKYGEAACEAAEFLSKFDWEGGVDGLYGYGGPSAFPVELHAQAVLYGIAYDDLRQAIDDWAAERGVEY